MPPLSLRLEHEGRAWLLGHFGYKFARFMESVLQTSLKKGIDFNYFDMNKREDFCAGAAIGHEK